MPFREAAVSQMLGFAAVGTPLCPTAAFTTPVPGVPPLPANPAAVCVLNVTASDQIDLRTGAGTINGKFTVVTADLFPAVDAPETIVIRGNFSGQIDFSPVLQSPPLPYGTVTGHFTSNAEGGHTPFFGVFLLPFADPQNQSGFGYLLYNLMPNSNCPQNVCIMSSPSQPIQLNQLSIGYPTARFDIIELDGRPIGRIVVDRSDTRVLIVDQAIVPELRNRGIGTAVMRAAMEDARTAGLPVRLHVASTNDPSLRLYLRLGFRPFEETPMYLELEWRPVTEENTAPC